MSDLSQKILAKLNNVQSQVDYTTDQHIQFITLKAHYFEMMVNYTIYIDLFVQIDKVGRRLRIVDFDIENVNFYTDQGSDPLVEITRAEITKHIKATLK